MERKTFRESRLSIAIKTALIGSGTALAMTSAVPGQAGEVEEMKQEIQQLICASINWNHSRR